MSSLASIRMTKADGSQRTIYYDRNDTLIKKKEDRRSRLGDGNEKYVYLCLKPSQKYPSVFKIKALKIPRHPNDLRCDFLENMQTLRDTYSEEFDIRGKNLFSVSIGASKGNAFYTSILYRKANFTQKLSDIPKPILLSLLHTMLKTIYAEFGNGINCYDDNFYNFGSHPSGSLQRFDAEDFRPATIEELKERLEETTKIINILGGDFLLSSKAIQNDDGSNGKEFLEVLLKTRELWIDKANQDQVKIFFKIPEDVSTQITLTHEEALGKTELQRAELAWNRLKAPWLE